MALDFGILGKEHEKDELLDTVKKTKFWSGSGYNLHVLHPDSEDHDYHASLGKLYARDDGGALTFVGNIDLPDGAEILSCTVYASDTYTIALMRSSLDGTGDTSIITGNTNAVNSTPNANTNIVDNKNYSIYLVVNSVAKNYNVSGISIEYVPKED